MKVLLYLFNISLLLFLTGSGYWYWIKRINGWMDKWAEKMVREVNDCSSD